jgi:hypothetical protein
MLRAKVREKMTSGNDKATTGLGAQNPGEEFCASSIFPMNLYSRPLIASSGELSSIVLV